jgi:dipeptidyl aminopeptidase/acylaminoacyl peptidase
VVLSNPKGTYETWVADLDRPGVKRVLALPNADCSNAVWSPDGQRLAYMRMARDQDDGIYIQRADGAGSPQAVLKADSPEVFVSPLSWAPDGSGLIVIKSIAGKGDILFVPVPAGAERGKIRVLRATSYNETNARFSPDGRLVAFISDESGKYETYVASYDPGGTLGPPLMVSSGGSGRVEWAGDSRRLFYYNAPDRLMSVTIETRPELSASAPVVVHDLKKLRVNEGDWDILPDGRLLAIQTGEEEGDIKQFNIVLNWLEELKQRVPVK